MFFVYNKLWKTVFNLPRFTHTTFPDHQNFQSGHVIHYFYSIIAPTTEMQLQKRPISTIVASALTNYGKSLKMYLLLDNIYSLLTKSTCNHRILYQKLIFLCRNSHYTHIAIKILRTSDTWHWRFSDVSFDLRFVTALETQNFWVFILIGEQPS